MHLILVNNIVKLYIIYNNIIYNIYIYILSSRKLFPTFTFVITFNQFKGIRNKKTKLKVIILLWKSKTPNIFHLQMIKIVKIEHHSRFHMI